MALAKCTECGKEVSTDAVTCPHCGYPMKHMSKGTPSPRQREELFLQGVNVGCAVILLMIGLFVFLMVIVFFNVSDRILEPEKKTQEQTVSKPE